MGANPPNYLNHYNKGLNAILIKKFNKHNNNKNHLI